MANTNLSIFCFTSFLIPFLSFAFVFLFGGFPTPASAGRQRDLYVAIINTLADCNLTSENTTVSCQAVLTGSLSCNNTFDEKASRAEICDCLATASTCMSKSCFNYGFWKYTACNYFQVLGGEYSSQLRCTQPSITNCYDLAAIIYLSYKDSLSTCPKLPQTCSMNCPFTASTLGNATDKQMCTCMKEARRCAKELQCLSLNSSQACKDYTEFTFQYRPAMECDIDCGAAPVWGSRLGGGSWGLLAALLALVGLVLM